MVKKGRSPGTKIQLQKRKCTSIFLLGKLSDKKYHIYAVLLTEVRLDRQQLPVSTFFLYFEIVVATSK